MHIVKQGTVQFPECLRYFISFLLNSITYNSNIDLASKTGENKNKIGSGDLMKVLTYLLGIDNKPTKAEVNLFIWVLNLF